MSFLHSFNSLFVRIFRVLAFICLVVYTLLYTFFICICFHMFLLAVSCFSFLFSQFLFLHVLFCILFMFLRFFFFFFFEIVLLAFFSIFEKHLIFLTKTLLKKHNAHKRQMFAWSSFPCVFSFSTFATSKLESFYFQWCLFFQLGKMFSKVTKVWKKCWEVSQVLKK